MKWNIDNKVFYTKYVRYNLSIDQGILNTPTEGLLPSDTDYRFGIQTEHSYIDNDLSYFKVYGSTGQSFPELSCAFGYSRDLGSLGRGCSEVYGIFLILKKFIFHWQRHLKNILKSPVYY